MTEHWPSATSEDLAGDVDVDLGRTRIHHASANFALLERLYPGQYPHVMVKGDGVLLYDRAGKSYIDCSQHLGSCAIGHGRSEMAAALAAQASTLALCPVDGGFSTEPMLRLAARLRTVVPVEDAALYFTSSGSESTEQAIKLARWYHAVRGDAKRVKIISRIGSYHGAGFGGISVSGNPLLREPFAPLLPGVSRIAPPQPGRCGHCEPSGGCDLRCASEFERVVQNEDPSTVAAFITEPLSMHQGVTVPHADYWAVIRDTCDRYGILLILDEVVTGFGRTGKWFGSEHWSVTPDIMILAKGITSGYCPLAATVVAGALHDSLIDQPLLHTNTNAGHSVACAAALTNLEIIEREELVDHAAVLGTVLRDELEALTSDFDGIRNASSLGLVGSVELPTHCAPDFLIRLRQECLERGVLIRGATDRERSFLTFHPPLVITADQVREVFEAVRDAYASVQPSRSH